MTEPTLPWETLEEKITADYERYKHEISRCNQCLEDTTEELRKTARRKDMFCRAGLIAHMKEFRGLHPNRFLECGSSDMLFEASLQTFPEHFIVKSLVSFNSKLCRNTECEVLSALPTHPGIVHPIATFVANLPSDWQNLIPPDIIFRDYVQGVPMVHIVFPDEGPSLESVTARMDMNDKVSRCCEWLKQLLVAVSHLQRNFVVHREIISRFILVSTGNLKLTGFDCALNADPAHGSELKSWKVTRNCLLNFHITLGCQLVNLHQSGLVNQTVLLPGFRPPYILPQLPPQFQRPSSQTQSTTTSCHPAYAVGDVLRSLLVADPKARIKTQAAIDILTQALQQNP
ncbi:hypothetical protein Pelo_5469 [Pelomyxa schiedti]|nr:hypothetical protein Pelo_5469 [Pelomyxa schiedti]